MAALIDATPAVRMSILVSDCRRAMIGRHASDSMRHWRNNAGLAPEPWDMTCGFRTGEAQPPSVF